MRECHMNTVLGRYSISECKGNIKHKNNARLSNSNIENKMR